MRAIDDYTHYHFIVWKKNGQVMRYEMMYLSFEFLAQDFDYMLCLKFDPPLDVFYPDMKDLRKSLEAIYDFNPDTFVMLTQRKKPPVHQVSMDEYIYSFSCSFHHFRKMISRQSRKALLEGNLLFELLDDIGDSGISSVLVRQLPIGLVEAAVPTHSDVVIPHRGAKSYLRTLLQFLKPIDNINVYVGADQHIARELSALRSAYPHFSYYVFSPNPVGPYVVRNWLADLGAADLIFFQDSDDIPCGDRFQRLSAYMRSHRIPLCGSHEIKMDYFNRTVQAVRYPKDVIAALKQGPAHALLHPSSAVARGVFYACNKLSEDRIFANDTKFLYYCYFKLETIENIDEFLYIRRSHPGSLTTSAGTSIGSAIRTELINRWVTDFTLIKRGLLKPENSCLNYAGPRRKFKVKKITR
ncbi:hypothetical protein SAMN06265348_101196 [Pedobacter westerhofensis]|uniref:Glycosyl transferase family 2 n=1 Tax=Pedobacter westerhofensis TaxID=425512 RepID=A0A521AH17_9SPHI|nr:glycosyltransferase family A protein [Pedobacter westerhofensis]SMO34117.1 hypothetical protein SAMN06265348_101196 [Pedobacter westerhofensis]